MAIDIRPYTEDMINAVKDFNVRVKVGGRGTFPEEHIPEWLPKIGDRKIYEEYLLALENASVRGAYTLKHQEFSFKGDIISIAHYRQPLSEGIVNKAYNLVGIQMLTSALKKQPLLFALGMGGYEQSLPKMLKAMGWSMYSVPFFFKVNHPPQFLRNITYLRKKRSKRLLLDFLAITGFGWIAMKLLQTLLPKKRLRNSFVSFEPVSDFSLWADELWNDCKDKYSMIAVRDSITLNILYPSDSKRFIRLQILQDDKVVGWAVVLDTQMSNHKQFGNMRVGSIVDCLALPEDAFKVVASAVQFLEKRDVDIIVSNQSHTAWRSAFRDAGFISGPSNFIFAASKGLAELLAPFDLNKLNIHLNRGDGDGPIRL